MRNCVSVRYASHTFSKNLFSSALDSFSYILLSLFFFMILAIKPNMRIYVDGAGNSCAHTSSEIGSWKAHLFVLCLVAKTAFSVALCGISNQLEPTAKNCCVQRTYNVRTTYVQRTYNVNSFSCEHHHVMGQ